MNQIDSSIATAGSKNWNPALGSSLYNQLRSRLLSLSYPAFLLLVARLLSRCGYASVHPVGRLYSPDGRLSGEAFQANASFQPGRFNPRHGGFDLIALARTDLATFLSLVQAKQYREPVPRRFIDELANAMRRQGAEHGLIFTTSHFSDLAREIAAYSSIRLVGCDELVQLLVERGMGLRGEPGKRREFDADYFNALEREIEDQRR